MRDNDWGISNYPMVPGHEGVGIVEAVGDCVRTLKIGDRVAITWIRDACQNCDACSVGRENICRNGYQGTYLGASAGPWGDSPLKYNEHGGAFSQVQRIEAKFAVKIPDGLPSEIACPLLCGGGTVYEPIVDFCPPGTKLGVSSIGGLGTAAIKLAKLRGVIVYALSQSPGKRIGALSAGADEFIDMTDPVAVESIKGKLDVIIDTCPMNGPVSPFLDLVKFDGIYCRVGIPMATDMSFSYDYIPLIFTQKKVVGSIVTGTARLAEMLELVMRNMDFMKDSPDWKIEHIPMDKVNDAMDALQNRTNKGYRIVLTWDNENAAMHA
jgi:D-arabinose 1-dehydrogenase-like Zn-dependent alcohol dehydrogenase